MSLSIPIVVKVSVEQKTFDPSAIDTLIYCINTSEHTFEITVNSESFTTIDDNDGHSIQHGSPSKIVILNPGKFEIIANVEGWEWDGHVGIKLSIKEKMSKTSIQKSYDFKQSKGDYIIPGTTISGRILKPL